MLLPGGASMNLWKSCTVRIYIIGSTLFLVFYHVDSSDVQYQIGTFAEAFVKYEKRFQTDIAREGAKVESSTY